jgi:5-methyltetrahydrofolate--homocysteine methyltransferase
MNPRGGARWPVMLGGAALTRAYVEDDLASIYDGEVRYARDAFEGLRLMDAIMPVKRGEPGAGELPALRHAGRVARRPARTREVAASSPSAATSPVDNPSPRRRSGAAGSSRGSALAEYSAYLDERATVPRAVGPEASRGGDGPVLRRAGRDRGPTPAADAGSTGCTPRACWRPPSSTATGPCWSEGDELVMLDPARRGSARWDEPVSRLHVPAAARDRTCAWPTSSDPGRVPAELRRGGLPAGDDGLRVSEAAAELFERTPTATTSSCTACRCSSPRPSRSTGTPGSARSWASPATTRTDLDGLI